MARSGVRLGTATTGTGPTASGAGMTAPHVRSSGRAGLAAMGPTGYLWLLVFVEVALIGFLRHTFRDHHGG